MSGEFDGAPLVAGTVRGVRRFRVDELGRLRSPQQGTVWRPGDNECECRRDQQAGWVPLANGTITWHYGQTSVALASPTKASHSFVSCKCGFYAYSDGHDAAEYGGDGTVAAVVEGWGDVMVGTRGFRAQHARVLAVHITDNATVSDREVAARAALERRYARFTFRPLWRRFAYVDDSGGSFIVWVGGYIAAAVGLSATIGLTVAHVLWWLSLLAAVFTVLSAWIVVTESRGYSAYLQWRYPTDFGSPRGESTGWP